MKLFEFGHEYFDPAMVPVGFPAGPLTAEGFLKALNAADCKFGVVTITQDHATQSY